MAAAFAELVSEGKLRFDDPIQKYLPGFRPEDDPDLSNATWEEVLQHTSGIPNPVVPWLGPKGKVGIIGDDFIELINKTPSLVNGESQRKTSRYSNVAYGLAVLVIEKRSQMSFADFVQLRILNPLGMRHTTVTKERLHKLTRAGHVACSYANLSDNSWTTLEHTWTDEANGPVLGMVGMRSSTRDMLVFISALMDAFVSTAPLVSKGRLGVSQWCQDPFQLLADVKHNPLKNIHCLIGGHYWELPCLCSGFEHNYDQYLPWVSTYKWCAQHSGNSYNLEVPERFSPPTKEHRLKSRFGVSAEDKQKVWAYNGLSFCGAVAVKFFPATRSAIVSFASGLDTGDAAEFSSLLAMQRMFRSGKDQEILDMVKTEVNSRHNHFDQLMLEVSKNQNVSRTRSMDLAEYIGQYVGLGITITVRWTPCKKHLEMRFDQQSNLPFILEPYDNDSFSFWPKSRDQFLAEGWLDWNHWEVGLFRFRRSSTVGREIAGVTWTWDGYSQPAYLKRCGTDTNGVRPLSNEAM